MKLLHKIVLLLALFTFSSVSVQAMDLICNFSEYNEKVPDKKVHDIRIHIFYDDDKTNIGYVYFGKKKKVDSVIDYNWDYLLFKIKYHYDYGKTDENSQIYDANTYIKEYTYIGIVQDVDENGWCKIYQRNKFSVGEEIEIMKPDGENITTKVLQIFNEDGEEQESAPHPKQVLYIRLDQRADHYDILRRQE